MTIDPAAMLRAATHLDAASTAATRGLEQDAPRFIGRRRAETRMRSDFGEAVAQARLAVRELEPLGAPLEDARAGVEQAIAEVDPRAHRNIAYRRTFAEFTDAVELLRLERDRLRLAAGMADVPADEAKATLQTEADAILDLPESDVTREHIWRLALLGGLPEAIRPRFPAPANARFPLEQLAVRRWNMSEDLVVRELRNVRVDKMRRAVEADPSVTRDALDAELAELLDREPPISIDDREAVERLSVMAGLREDLRPAPFAAREVWEDYPISSIGARAGDAGMRSVASMKFDTLRMAIEHERMLADPAVTRESVAREVVSLLARPMKELDPDAQRRLSLLLRAPEHLRPPLPVPKDATFRFEDLGLLRRNPANDLRAAGVYAQGRLHVLSRVAPNVLVDELRATSRTGEPLDARLAASILDQHPELLERAGIEPWQLHDDTLELLAGERLERTELGDRLALLRFGVERTTPSDDAQGVLRTDLLDMIDRNVARTRSERHDTFADHPDYAEVGRIVENARLLRMLHPSSSPPPTTAEVVTW